MPVNTNNLQDDGTSQGAMLKMFNDRSFDLSTSKLGQSLRCVGIDANQNQSVWHTPPSIQACPPFCGLRSFPVRLT